MGWKLPRDWGVANYALYTFGRLTTPFSIHELKRRIRRLIEDCLETRGRELNTRVYADYIVLAMMLTGIGWVVAIILMMLIHSLTHDWKQAGGRRWIPDYWATKLYGATQL